MKPLNLAALGLRAHLALRAMGPVSCAGLVLCLLGAAALLWLVPQRALQAEQHQVALRLASMPAGAALAPAPPSANFNLVRFYDALGEQRYAEQQVKTLFGIAAKSGLALSQGEYKSAYDANGRLYTYQVTLPVKGSYLEVWQFVLSALMAIPFASLDEISFRRDNITDPAVEARLRLTLYLAERPHGAQR
ncbi:MAG: hypothetical protein V4723_14925 [Pseudomonadota bacterium]